MVSTLIWSYRAWVPTNFTQTIPARYCISTTRRYLLPAILNTTRLLPHMLALLYCSFMFCGVFQLALIASSNQLCKAPFESAHSGGLQNLTSVLFATTCIRKSPVLGDCKLIEPSSQYRLGHRHGQQTSGVASPPDRQGTCARIDRCSA